MTLILVSKRKIPLASDAIARKYTFAGKNENKITTSKSLSVFDAISRRELIYSLFFTNAAVVNIAVITLIINVAKVSANNIFTLSTRFSGTFSINSMLNVIIDETKSKTPAIIRSATRTELKYLDALSMFPLLYSIEINLPDIELRADVTMVAYWTKLFASPINP